MRPTPGWRGARSGAPAVAAQGRAGRVARGAARLLATVAAPALTARGERRIFFPMRTLVTGATGLVGNNVVRLLVDRGETVRVLVRPGADPRPLAGLPVEVVEGDVTDPASVAAAVRDAGRVIHAAGAVHIGWLDADAQHRVNVEGTRNVVAAVRAAGARLLFVSTVNTLQPGTPDRPADETAPDCSNQPWPYAVTKLAAERVVRQAAAEGLNAAIVNPGYMLGPWDWKPSSGRMVLTIARTRPWVAPPGGLQVLDVRDAAAGIVAALDRAPAGARYLLAGTYLPFFELFTRVAEVVGQRPPARVAVPWRLRCVGGIADLWARATGHESDLNSAAIGASLIEHCYTDARARQELDWQPRPPREAIEGAYAWFREHGYLSTPNGR